MKFDKLMLMFIWKIRKYNKQFENVVKKKCVLLYMRIFCKVVEIKSVSIYLQINLFSFLFVYYRNVFIKREVCVQIYIMYVCIEEKVCNYVLYNKQLLMVNIREKKGSRLVGYVREIGFLW